VKGEGEYSTTSNFVVLTNLQFRDIKCENLIFSDQSRKDVKLIDFGAAIKLPFNKEKVTKLF